MQLAKNKLFEQIQRKPSRSRKGSGGNDGSPRPNDYEENMKPSPREPSICPSHKGPQAHSRIGKTGGSARLKS